MPDEPVPAAPFRRRDLAELGIPPSMLADWLRDGQVVQPVRGVYLDARRADDLAERARALALLVGVDVVVARRAAAWLYGVDCRDPGTEHRPLVLECLVRAGRTPLRRPEIRCYEAVLPSTDVQDLGGVHCTTPERTAIDLARWLQPHMGLGVVDALAARHLVDPASLLVRVEEWRGERFVDQARRLIGFCEPLTESFGESWLRLRMLDAGFPRPEAQIRIEERGRLVYRLDLGYQDRRIGAEYDGVDAHEGDGAEALDEERRQRLERDFGWHVVGVGRGLVLGRSLELERGLGELLGIEPVIRRRLW